MNCEPSKIEIIPGKAPLECGPLLLKLLGCKKRIIVCQGGGSASKTSDILKFIALKSISNQNYIHQSRIVGQDVPNLKMNSMQIFKKYIASHESVRPFITKYNISEREYQFKKALATFTAFADGEDAKGSENDIVYMNEANNQSYEVFFQLQRKAKLIILDYNPSFAFWAHARLLNPKSPQYEKELAEETQLFITDHRHNPFLSEKEHAYYENISDPERFRVYSRGLTGKVSGMIFNMQEVTEIPQRLEIVDGREVRKPLPFGFGIDVGYTTDKTAVVKVYIDGIKRYYQELLYMSNSELQEYIKQMGLKDARGEPISIYKFIADLLEANGYVLSNEIMVYGDHDGEMSRNLRRLRVGYRMARKGPNSLVASISSTNRCENYYYQSPHLAKELATYVWETVSDPLTGNEVSTGVPVDGMPDHLIAAIRMFNHSFGMRHSGDEGK